MALTRPAVIHFLVVHGSEMEDVILQVIPVWRVRWACQKAISTLKNPPFPRLLRMNVIGVLSLPCKASKQKWSGCGTYTETQEHNPNFARRWLHWRLCYGFIALMFCVFSITSISNCSPAPDYILL